MAVLRKDVYVRDPDRHRNVRLAAGEEPEPRLAVLITNPDAWEDGKLPDLSAEPADDNGEPDTSRDSDGAEESHGAEDTAKKAAPAAKKTAAKRAATSRSRGRDAAAEGDSGE